MRPRPPLSTSMVPMDQLGPQSGVDSMSGFRAPRDGSGPLRTNQGPKGRIRTPQAGSGPHMTNQPSRRTRTTQDEPGLAEQIRVMRDGSGSCGTNQDPLRGIRVPQDKSGPCGTDQSPAGRIGAPQKQTKPRPTERIRCSGIDKGPLGRTRVPQDESGPRRTNQDPAE